MGIVRPPGKVKLIVGMLAGDVDLFGRAKQLLCRQFGPVELESPIWPFTATDYYQAEMGPDLKRRFLAFAELIQPDRLAEIKRGTNELEARICDDLLLERDRRAVNLDPGYMSLSKLVLASTKDHVQRVYLQQGIYAEVTLRYEHGRWQAWPWTYPDYADKTYHSFFQEVRDRLRRQLG
ncbi:MAG: DUF4416 family protein [Phycisphaerae bacterium]